MENKISDCENKNAAKLSQSGYTAEIDQTFRGNMEMCSADN